MTRCPICGSQITPPAVHILLGSTIDTAYLPGQGLDPYTVIVFDPPIKITEGGHYVVSVNEDGKPGLTKVSRVMERP